MDLTPRRAKLLCAAILLLPALVPLSVAAGLLTGQFVVVAAGFGATGERSSLPA